MARSTGGQPYPQNRRFLLNFQRSLCAYFETETTNDCMGLEVGMAPEKFDTLKATITNGRPVAGIVRLGRVSGFYSHWSPSIRTNIVKVLVNAKDHKVEMPEGMESQPPGLGEIGEIEITLRNQSTASVPITGDEEEDEPRKAPEVQPPSPTPVPVLSPADHAKMLAGAVSWLRWPLWAIIVLLVVGLFVR